MVDARARDLDHRFPAASRCGLQNGICRCTLQVDFGFGAIGLTEHYAFRQRKGELDQLALLLAADLPNFDAVEGELPGLLSVQREPRIFDGGEQSLAVAPDLVGVRTDPRDRAIRTRSEPRDKRFDFQLETIDIRLGGASGGR